MKKLYFSSIIQAAIILLLKTGRNSIEVIPMKNITVMSDEKNLDFEKAREMAMTEARKHLQNPMLISWYDSPRQRHFPNTN
ncbi:MAG: hypothetical protein A2161_22705 [Candidatus Schekmanbacteria bacterium RBG_13_48_7]|uniref:DUF5619 domain-containing protein n=1 Tax=Candidatus Schekmanbacteria bacterium RBG_13_48_7 TaxID=1817878 RepID=A0A1F7S443_9BACT|nr:MAG: hypothetical protein A2161_22705 [Candidatus Schekmanbacteria bacterium RBG_13_48_7]